MRPFTLAVAITCKLYELDCQLPGMSYIRDAVKAVLSVHGITLLSSEERSVSQDKIRFNRRYIQLPQTK